MSDSETPCLLDYLPPPEDPEESAITKLIKDKLIQEDVIQEEFESSRAREFGTKNPQIQDVPFYNAMIRSNYIPDFAYTIMERKINMRVRRYDGVPTWTLRGRRGQSTTILPDKRIVAIGGVYGGYPTWDVDYCRYNDVLVVQPKQPGQLDSTFTLYGYPEATFPPNAFHSATLVGEDIYIIGGQGSKEKEKVGTETQVFRLSTKDFSIEKVETKGKSPGWICYHQARAISSYEILIEDSTEILEVRSGLTGMARLLKNYVALFNIKNATWKRFLQDEPGDEEIETPYLGSYVFN
ncbi:hypothetical protein F4821DRAFT_264237 [Hypoxylon rubiginosum]|uniref:Uncharacterized protein n=1 Tax=Hypoxylon rubiginosum TaxID=110542 RepID=A0ACC0CNY9_9PEZI|nr:hypothetical protein F4821DRAFT_264237 [Hypoxylon rubiginosum]